MSHEEVSHNASHRSMRAAAKTVMAANRFSDAGRQMMAQKKAYGLTLTSPLHVPEPLSEFDGLTAFRAGPRRDPRDVVPAAAPWAAGERLRPLQKH